MMIPFSTGVMAVMTNIAQSISEWIETDGLKMQLQGPWKSLNFNTKI